MLVAAVKHAIRISTLNAVYTWNSSRMGLHGLEDKSADFFFFFCLVLRPFQDYFTRIEPIVNQRWAKTGVPREKPPDLPLQNLASHM